MGPIRKSTGEKADGKSEGGSLEGCETGQGNLEKPEFLQGDRLQ